MKIAVTTDGDQIFQHFGKCQTFTVFTVENGKITGKELIDASENGHAALTGFLNGMGVDTVICGGIGEGARNMLASAGINLISGIDGAVEDAVGNYISGTLTDLGGACDHHSHHDCASEHQCDCQNHH